MEPDPFTTYLGLDFVRLVVALLGIVLTGLVAKIAYKRGTEVREVDPPAYMIVTPLLSYALFVGMAVVREIEDLGEPGDWPLTVRAVALLLGVYSALVYCEVPGFRSKNTARPRWHFR
jgi:hypothetical protein